MRTWMYCMYTTFGSSEDMIDSVYSFSMNTNFALPNVAHSSMMGNTSALDGSGRSTASPNQIPTQPS